MQALPRRSRFACHQDLARDAARQRAREEPRAAAVRREADVPYDITNCASSAATIRSQASASEKPAPAAAPSTAAITGFGKVRIASIQLCEPVDALRLHRRVFRAVVEQALQVAARAEEVAFAGDARRCALGARSRRRSALRCRRRTSPGPARCGARDCERVSTSMVPLPAGALRVRRSWSLTSSWWVRRKAECAAAAQPRARAVARVAVARSAC